VSVATLGMPCQAAEKELELKAARGFMGKVDRLKLLHVSHPCLKQSFSAPPSTCRSEALGVTQAASAFETSLRMYLKESFYFDASITFAMDNPQGPLVSLNSSGHAMPSTSANHLYKACRTCRRQKMRCDGGYGTSCQRCIKAGVECVYDRTASKR
jgi:hypothetical protein